MIGLRKRSRARPRALRVAFVTDGLYPYFKGGKEVRSHHLIRGVSAAGVEVDVYTMRWWDGRWIRREGRVTYRAICPLIPMYAGNRRSFSQAFVFALASLRLLFHSYDLIDADHMPYLQMVPLRLVAWLRRVPLVVTWHEWWGRDYWVTYLGVMGPLAAFIERTTAKLADHIVVETHDTAGRLCSAGVDPGRISVISLGVDTDLIATSPTSDQGYDVVFVGRLLAHKGTDILLRAVQLLGLDGVRVTVGIVGDGPERLSLRRLANHLGVATQVEFIGELADQTEVFGIMKAAGVFVLPSLREGYGLVVAEALMCGTRVVTVDHPDNHARHLVHDQPLGLLADPNPRALADAITKALDLRLVGQPASGGSFDWRTRADELLTLYRGQVAVW
jgi:glycosyltransferase involved in cell wall biosynthesis